MELSKYSKLVPSNNNMGCICIKIRCRAFSTKCALQRVKFSAEVSGVLNFTSALADTSHKNYNRSNPYANPVLGNPSQGFQGRGLYCLKNGIGIGICQVLSLCNSLTGQIAFIGVQAVHQRLICLTSRLCAHIGNL